jgi:hypothetical protein
MVAILQALAVERLQRERRDVDTVEAIDVDRDGLLAVRRDAARERADAAGLAKQVMDFFLPNW